MKLLKVLGGGAAVCGVLLLAAPAMAEQHGGHAEGKAGHAERKAGHAERRIERLQERLGLSAEQTEAVRQLFDQARATRKKQREAMHEAVAQILTAPQLEKFKALRAERKAAHEAEHAKRKAERAAAP
jgi:Spy/CpxP family protein refolding chaperone